MTTASGRTRVARRILLLFGATALLPVLAALLLTELLVRQELEREQMRVLTELAESHGVLYFERLALVDRVLAASPSAGALDADAGVISAVASVAADGAVTVRRGTVPPALQTRLAQAAPRSVTRGKPAIALLHTTGAAPEVWMFSPRSVDGVAPEWIAGRVDGRYLWGDAEAPAVQAELCVLGLQDTPLFCPEALPAQVLDQIGTHRTSAMSGSVRWTGSDGEGRISAYRELFLNGRFDAPPWFVVLTQPDAVAQAPLKAVHRVIVPIVALSLLAAALFGLVQVRRTMRPLALLSEAARRIGTRDFSVRVDAHRNDEFGTLGQAFNAMSRGLAAQFDAMQTLADIDRRILSGGTLGDIGTLALTSLGDRHPASRRALILATGDDDARLTLQAWDGATRIALDFAVPPRTLPRARLEAAAGALEVTADDAAGFGLGLLAEHGARRMIVHPILADGRLAGLLALDPGPAALASGEAADFVADLAGRLAVAVTAARRERVLRHRALFDALTGLPNRTNLIERLDAELAALGDRQIAVLFIDLDGFAHVNDTLGHEAGDQMLGQVGQRLRANTRPDDLVARLGGDEFVLALLRLEDTEQAAQAARRVIEALAAPFTVAGAEVFVAGSIGVAVAPAHGHSAAELLRNADLAMYRAKARGRGSLCFFDPAMHQAVLARATLDAELRRALHDDEFVLHYEPLVDGRDGRVRGAEALIRWNHPTRGLLAPGGFIGIAEDTGLIEPIGQWVLRTACAQFVMWRTAGLALDDISVNVSTQQFRRPDFVRMVSAILADSGMQPGWLKLEITESVLVDESGEAERTLVALAALGVKLALDDFGTGYSSLAYLKRLPVDVIKIDRSFVRDIQDSADAQALVRSTIDMAHALRKRVTAEGVELAAQQALLSSWGCDLLQGWLFTRSLPAEGFQALVAQRAARLVTQP
ncbi:MAG TPA: EAL domain-containing protein [Quisquiliibacterium sp.]|nr:EAL domain-containing protein [Quisquiliibacterium sp.]